MTSDDVIRKLEELRHIRESLRLEIITIQDEECAHDWKKTGHWNDHDGWSTHVDVTYGVDYMCLICDKHRSDTTVVKER